MNGVEYDAVVIGSGPNGLVAAITIARTGRRVLVVEGQPTLGGGARSAELTEPGFVHDICSAIHPLGIASPALRELALERHGLRWIQPAVPFAHPLDDRTVVQERAVSATAAGLGRDGRAWTRLFGPHVEAGAELVDGVLSPLSLPRHPLAVGRFGLTALRSASSIASRRFETEDAKALFAGLAAHSICSFDQRLTAGVALFLGVLGHHVGWPLPAGGSQEVAGALAAELAAHGGTIECGRPITDLGELPPSTVVLADLSPRNLARIAGDRLSKWTRRQYSGFRHGPAVFKVDYALSDPVPWRDPRTSQAGTVHVGGTFDEVAAAEAAVCRGEHTDKPFVLVAQQSLFDPSRAPAGRHTLWAYCHVPNGSTVDMTEAIERQIERFAPGFRDTIVARHRAAPADVEAGNANYVGGDISGGVTDLRQLFTRPTLSLRPWIAASGLYLCSASTPPGAGVHGMCGLHAARLALKRELK
ncbi:MAG: phytoene desaturase family protein [Acidimicrobiales bacterium]